MIELLDEAFFGPSWHGPSLLGALRGLTDTQAAWRPAKKRHNIWELAIHAAYWKYIARRRLTGQRERFPVKGSNWFVRPSDDRRWKEDVKLLIDEHERLRDVVIAVPETALTQRLGDGRYTKGHLIRGIAAHDLYHAGQIQLLKRLQSGGPE